MVRAFFISQLTRSPAYFGINSCICHKGENWDALEKENNLDILSSIREPEEN
jgi:hypothetical protein